MISRDAVRHELLICCLFFFFYASGICHLEFGDLHEFEALLLENVNITPLCLRIEGRSSALFFVFTVISSIIIIISIIIIVVVVIVVVIIVIIILIINCQYFIYLLFNYSSRL